MAQRIGLGSIFQILIHHMRIDHGGIKVFVAQNFFQGTNIHAVLIHQRCRRMPEFMYRAVLLRKTCGAKILFDQSFYRLHIDALTELADKQGIFVTGFRRDPMGEIGLNRAETGLIEINHTLFVALAQHAEAIIGNILQIDANQLGNTHTAVQEEGNDAIIPLFVLAVDGFQQLQAFPKGQILGQSILRFGHIQTFGGVFVDQLKLFAIIFIKSAQGRDLAGAGANFITISGFDTFMMFGALSGCKNKKIQNFCTGNTPTDLDVTDRYPMATVWACDVTAFGAFHRQEELHPREHTEKCRILCDIAMGIAPADDENTRLLISELIREGYVSMENGKPVSRVPVIDSAVRALFDEIGQELQAALEEPSKRLYQRVSDVVRATLVPQLADYAHGFTVTWLGFLEGALFDALYNDGFLMIPEEGDNKPYACRIVLHD